MIKNLSNEPILFVDDDTLWLDNTLRGLRILGLKGVEGCSNPLEVLDLLKIKEYALIVIDLWMPQKPGEILLSEIKQHYPHLPVIVITADNQTETAVKCMRSGAVNYLTKPIEPNQVIAHIRQVVETRRLERENSALCDIASTSVLDAPIDFFFTLSQSVSMQKIFDYIGTLSQSILPILITGEEGCGKRRLAKSIHKAHKRTGEFIEVDLANVENTSELFCSAATGSIRDLIGNNPRATIYISNYTILEEGVQEGLLSVFQEIQDDYHNAVISILEVPRIIIASKNAIIAGTSLCEDLRFLLNIQHISIPPLRERKADIPLLAHYFIDKYIVDNNINTPHVPKELMPLLQQYQYPKNIKELEDMFYDALSRCNRGKLSLESFKEHMEKGREGESEGSLKGIFASCSVLPTFKEAQHLLLLEALKRADGNQAHAAHLLGITRQGLNRKIQTLGIASSIE